MPEGHEQVGDQEFIIPMKVECMLGTWKRATTSHFVVNHTTGNIRLTLIDGRDFVPIPGMIRTAENMLEEVRRSYSGQNNVVVLPFAITARSPDGIESSFEFPINVMHQQLWRVCVS